jgi:hypothetical protein
MPSVALALGGGIGKLFQAAALGQGAQDKAYQDAMTKQALIGQRGATMRLHDAQTGLATANTGIAQGVLAGGTPDKILEAAMNMQGLTDQSARPAIAERLATGQWGGHFADAAPVDGVGPMLPKPVTDEGLRNIARAMGVAQRAQATKSNVLQETGAGLNLQRQQMGAGVMDGSVDPALVQTAQAAMAGRRYVDPIGVTGQSMGPGGEAGPVNEPLSENYAAAETIKRLLNVARTGQAAASAGSSAALAGSREADTSLTRDKQAYLAKEGRLPGSGQGATDSTNTKDYNRRVAEARKANPTGTPAEIAADVARFESLYAKPPIKQEARPNAGEAPAAPAAPKIDMGAADKIKAKFQSGAMTKAEAKAALQKLGMD